jgi:nucleoside phosphorylase
MASRERLDSHEQYTVAWIAALPHERAAATAMLDERRDKPKVFEQSPEDTNAYTWGRIGDHNVVIASLPAGEYGTTIAATTANTLRFVFPHIRLGLMVGIGAGVPQSKDVRLGDVVVSQPYESSGGVVQYDLNKARQEGRFLTGHLAMPPEMLRNALAKLQAEHDMEDSIVPSILEAMVQKFPKMNKQTPEDPRYTHPGAGNDRLFASWSPHLGGADCGNCTDTVPRDRRRSTNPEIHYGVIASGNTLVKTAEERNDILERLPDNLRSKCLCIEMEAAGLMNTFPCIVIRGICDYADSHKKRQMAEVRSRDSSCFCERIPRLRGCPGGEESAGDFASG